jgi:demethylmenaquinone methyltransferase/2-methoxy-6-polyprenyl-1,4-benzoquinol methylase
MPFRDAFSCLWCGRPWDVRSADDIEGWAQLCSDCVGRAGENGFLRFRLKTALAERARGAAAPAAPGVVPAPAAAPAVSDSPAAASASGQPALHDEMLAYYAARAPEYDDWYVRRGRYSHGAIDDMAWQMDLDQATRWLDAQDVGGEIVELAAGTGWWSPLLAQRGELWLYDGAPEPLERARERLLAHGLRAHLHVRDAWAKPDRQVDVVFAGFWLSHVATPDLSTFLGVVRRWLRPGGSFLFIDSRDDPASGGTDHHRERTTAESGRQRRRLADGREFMVVKEFHAPDALAAALADAGFGDVEIGATSRFFQLGRAVAR